MDGTEPKNISETAESADHGTVKAFRLKKPVRIIIGSVIALIMIFIAGVIVSGRKTAEINLYYSPQKKSAVIFCDDKLSDNTVSANSVSAVRYSGKRNSCALLVGKNGAYGLYYINEKKALEISKSCTNKFVISVSGNTVAFYDSNGVLKIFDGKSGKITEITSSVDKFALSPDGSTLIYCKTEESINNLYIYKNGKSLLLGQNYTPLAVSEDSKYIYVVSVGDKSLCILGEDGSMKSKLCTGVSMDYFCFTQDMSQVIFSDGNYTYVSVEGKSRIRLIQGIAKPVASSKTVCDSECVTAVCMSDSMSKGYFMTDEENAGTLFFADKNFSCVDVAISVSDVFVTSGNDAVILTSDGKVSFFSNDSSETMSTTVQNAVKMQVSSDGKYIYYLTQDSEVYVNRKDENTKLASGVSDMSITPENRLLYILSDGSLYSAYKVKNNKKEDENVHSLSSYENAFFYSKNYNSQSGLFDVYSSDGSLKFNETAKNVTWIV